jgi:hypothetical protein
MKEMKTYMEVNRKIFNEDVGQIVMEHNFYLNDQEIGVRVWDNMLHSDMDGKSDFVVITEEKQEHILKNKAYLVRSLTHRKFFEYGVMLAFVNTAV